MINCPAKEWPLRQFPDKAATLLGPARTAANLLFPVATGYDKLLLSEF